MKNILLKLKKTFRSEGFIKTLFKLFNFPINRLKRFRFQSKVLSMHSSEDRFTWIYTNNYWSSTESRSGSGSTLKYTDNLRRELPSMFREYGIAKVFDAPCGDFNWMRHLLPTVKIVYIGGDIVKPLIRNLNIEFNSSDISFVHFDLIREIPPKVDLMICRDCLFHFSFKDTKSVLENFIKSESTYLLTTTHINMEKAFLNCDIKTGDFRCIDLFLPPYNFSALPLFTIKDWLAPDPERQMCLWNREQILLALSTFKI
jgi:hypothetical protein